MICAKISAKSVNPDILHLPTLQGVPTHIWCYIFVFLNHADPTYYLCKILS